MRRQLRTGFVMLLVLTVVTGLLYPLVVTGIGQAAFHEKANGSLVSVNGTVVGSRWIGQPFTAAGYFHPRPSAAGTGYDGAASAGSNLGPTSTELLDAVKANVAAYRQENGLSDTTTVPVDAVTASASGLDPDISVANARLQAPRVARARGLDEAAVLRLVDQHTDGRGLGFLGEQAVNVLELNIALDRLRR